MKIAANFRLPLGIANQRPYHGGLSFSAFRISLKTESDDVGVDQRSHACLSR
jgi:hypothetical protein